MYQNDWLDLFFLISLIVMWAILIYHSFLVIVAFHFFKRGKKQLNENLKKLKSFPFVSILIPAHNEEIVIESTLNAILELNYPRDRVEVIVVNDSSTDRTGQILDQYAEKYRRIKPFHIPEGKGGLGKSHALNLALKRAKGEVICVFDADNSPEPNSLHYLIAELMSNDKLAAVCGKVRTQNRKKNLLTHFINLEFIAHQWIVQAGRWLLHHVATIPGTNFVIWKQVLDKMGGWDEEALTEDAELTIRIFDMGYLISFNPFAITWEQEPETWHVWFRQRLRWSQGNQYIIRKYFNWLFFNFKSFVTIFYMIGIYFFLLFTIVLSDIVFLGGVFNFAKVAVSGPLFFVWFLAFLLFVLAIVITTSFEETSENTLENVGYIILMYFTYCQIWIFLSLRSYFLPFKTKKGKPYWAKTPRIKQSRS